MDFPWFLFLIVAAVSLAVLAGIGWVFYSRVDSPWMRMGVSSLLAATFLTAITPMPIGCCGQHSIMPFGLLILMFPSGIPVFAIHFGPWFLMLSGGIFAIRVVSYGLNALWTRVVGDRQVPFLQSSRVDERIQRRLDG